MNDNKDDWATVHWQEAWAGGRTCVSPQGGSEACSRKAMCTVGMEQDLKIKGAAHWLCPLPKKTPAQLCASWAAVTEFIFPASAIVLWECVSEAEPGSGACLPSVLNTCKISL